MLRLAAGSLALLVLAAVPAWASDEGANKEIVRRMIEAINERDYDALDRLVAADVERHCAAMPNAPVHSLEDFKAFLRQDVVAVPDGRQDVEAMIAEGDLVAVRGRYHGTQSGPMGRVPPSGKHLEFPFLAMLRIANGKVAEMWVEWDNLSAMAQLGHLGPGAPEAEGPDVP